MLVDFVTMPGEFSVRGGIIDVFPFSSICPCRINFLDDIPVVYRFNIDSQLTTTEVDNFILSSIANNEPLPLTAVSHKKFLNVDFDGSDELYIGGLSVSQKHLELKTVTHRQFYNMDRTTFKSVSSTGDLSSVGVVDENNNIVVPFWFLEKGPPLKKKERVYAPLELSAIKRGDYLVHRDYGVGVCLGLALKEGGLSAQELLSIKYNDGGVISIDTGSLDLVAFFAPADAEGVALDSLSKKGNWTRKRLSAKKRAEEIIQHLLSLYVKRHDLSRPPFPQGKRGAKAWIPRP